MTDCSRTHTQRYFEEIFGESHWGLEMNVDYKIVLYVKTTFLCFTVLMVLAVSDRPDPEQV